jgi:hypothetical protein
MLLVGGQFIACNESEDLRAAAAPLQQVQHVERERDLGSILPPVAGGVEDPDAVVVLVEGPGFKHFTSWLGLCPGTRITGGKLLSGRTRRCANRAAQALRMAAAALRSSKSALGAYFRRMCARMDKPKAITAAAHKLARLIYTMLAKGQEYVDQGQDYFEERYRERVIRQLSQRASKLGLKVTIAEHAA